nr:MAG TPA: RecT protein [Caudoviricetes sp.]
MSQAVATRNTTNVATIENWVESDNVKKKFQEVLDKGAGAFVTSLLSLVKSTPQLAAADPKTILSAAMTAATLKLPISPNLGFAYIIPYGKEAQFQMGYKGYIQLAMRTGQYKTINASVVYEGQIEDIDFVTGEIIRGKKKSDKVVGYVAYFELINGFSKTIYMTTEDMLRHAQTFSKSFSRSSSVWKTNFDAMGLKTVIKQLISKYGIMSIDMQSDLATAISSDVDYDRAETQNVTPLEQAAAEQTIDAEADVVDAPVEGEPEPPAEAAPVADVYDGMDF